MFWKALIFAVVSAAAAVLTVLELRFGDGAWPLPRWLAPVFTVLVALAAQVELWQAFGQLEQDKHDRLLHETGIPGTAHVVNAEHTGTTENGHLKIKCTLAIVAPGYWDLSHMYEMQADTPHMATVNVVLPMAKVGRLTSNDPLPVLINPSDPDDIFVDW